MIYKTFVYSYFKFILPDIFDEQYVPNQRFVSHNEFLIMSLKL